MTMIVVARLWFATVHSVASGWGRAELRSLRLTSPKATKNYTIRSCNEFVHKMQYICVLVCFCRPTHSSSICILSCIRIKWLFVFFPLCSKHIVYSLGLYICRFLDSHSDAICVCFFSVFLFYFVFVFALWSLGGWKRDPWLPTVPASCTSRSKQNPLIIAFYSLLINPIIFVSIIKHNC